MSIKVYQVRKNKAMLIEKIARMLFYKSEEIAQTALCLIKNTYTTGNTIY
jgi:hypothetical protein